MTLVYQELKTRYEQAGQGHVFQFFDQLNNQEQQSFLSQLSSINVEKASCAAQFVLNAKNVQQLQQFEPLPQNFMGDGDSLENRAQWFKIGMDLISQNKVAVILMAGGQGTRLGSPAPKGCYDIGLPSHKSLFQLQAERILRLQTLASETQKVVIPWYIMTSGPTDQPTREFFAKNNYFGLDPEQVEFFKQGVLPCFTHEGKIMLESKGKVAVAPDGNGGIYDALYQQGIIESLKSKGIRYSHCYCVDNCLARVADPVFIGYCASRNADCGIKVVPKLMPEEPVGVVALRDGKYGVVEYSEISQELATKRHENGQLAFGAANIANHIFSTDFLERVPAIELEYHVANKKIPCVDLATGELVKPAKPNGIKLERFVFDVLPFCQQFSVLQTDRKDEFSPLKNGPGAGVDCPETSRSDILNQAKRFIQNAGGRYANQELEIEISPLFSYGGENLDSISGQTVKQSRIINTLEDLASVM